MQFNADNVRKRKCTSESTGCATVHKSQMHVYIKVKIKDQTALGTNGPDKLQTVSRVFLALKIGQPPAHSQKANTAIP